MILLENSAHLNILQHILSLDYHLFTKINRQWTNPFFDAIMPFLREAEFWTPLYLFFLVFAILNFSKKGIIWCISLIMNATVSDFISSGVVKQLIFRLRPCQDPVISPYVRVLAQYCPHSSSFTSSHACNHFSAAIFIFMTMGHHSRWWLLIFVWAIAISYAQIYVGVHYPFDVLGGAVLGTCIGLTMSNIFTKRFGLPETNNLLA